MAEFRGFCRDSKIPITTVFVLLFLSSVLLAQEKDPHAQHRQMQHEAADESSASMRIDVPDAELVTQDGQAVKLASDVIGDRIVVVDFVYTTCTTVCPVLSAILRQVQERLDERLGSEVMLVSISVDPNRDTPARLKAYSGKLGAQDGWLWLTGEKTVVDMVLKDLGAYTPNFEDHPSMILVGDGQSGEWGRFLGFPGAEQIMTRIDELSAARMQAATKE
jgi:protein SCO1/2